MQKPIKAGERYECLKDYVMHDGYTAYIKGRIYISIKDGTLNSIEHEEHKMPIDSEFNDYFKLVKKENLP